MKKFFVLLLAIPFLSCSKTVYVDSQSGKEIAQIGIRDFIDLETVKGGFAQAVLHDKKSDILYYLRDNRGITPIMKPDGTCLTYSEWKQRELGGIVSEK